MIFEETIPKTTSQKETVEACSGFLLINKPAWKTSFSIIKTLRDITGVQKIGHAGTLDPFATGLLIVGIGKNYTTRITEMQNLPKEYVATMLLGVETDTEDRDGKIKQLKMMKNTVITDKMLSDVVSSFTGDFMQIPPLYCAKSIGGKRAYKLARKGRNVTLSETPVFISKIEMLGIRNGIFPECTIRVNCSKGTYIRALVRDIALGLNTCGFTKSLIRTKIGDYSVSDALTLDTLDMETLCKNLIQ